MNVTKVISLNILAAVGVMAMACDGTVPESSDSAQPALARHVGGAPERVVVYANEREVLKQYDLDLATGALTFKSSVTFLLPVQYAAADAHARHLYVSTSDGATNHALFAHDIAKSSGVLTQKGAPLVPGGGRIINLSVNKQSNYLALAHNQTNSAAAVALGADGALGGGVVQGVPAATGFFPHQARFDNAGRAVIVPGLGAAATATAPEQRGTLTTFDFADGQLTNGHIMTLAPGIGARHLDFHGELPLVYVAMERGNRLSTYGYKKGKLSAEPLFDTTTLEEPGNVRPRQRAGAIHLHPNQRLLYVSNRADFAENQIIDNVPVPIFVGGENSIAVFRLAQKTGKPTLIQRVPTLGFEARSFSIDPTGTYLIVGNQVSRNIRDASGAVVAVPRSIVVFRICADGRLELRQKYDVTGGDVLWVGSYKI